MTDSKPQVLDVLRRIKGPDLEGNIVDLGLVSEILVKDDRVYFSITVPAARAEELEPLRRAAEKRCARGAGRHGRGRRPDGRGGARQCRRHSARPRERAPRGTGKSDRAPRGNARLAGA